MCHADGLFLLRLFLLLPTINLYGTKTCQRIIFSVSARMAGQQMSLGIEWLPKIYESNTALRTIGEYSLLNLDGHATTEFGKFCMKKNIIPICMPPHSSHLLQPLDVSCFSLLKPFYTQKVGELAQKSINSIKKVDFLYIYPSWGQPR